jgi:hypothetical protein
VSRARHNHLAAGIGATLFGLFALVWLAFATSAKADPSDYGFASVSASRTTSQAGDHPDMTLFFKLKTDPSSPTDEFGRKQPYAQTRDLSFELPPGLTGNLNAVPTCTTEQLASFAVGGPGCPQDTQVGVTVIDPYLTARLTEPIYNMEAPGEGDTVARLGFLVLTVPNYINIRLRSDSDYGLTASLEGLPAPERLVSASSTIWGVPAASSHDTQRLTPKEAFDRKSESPPRASGLEPRPFLTNPTSCGDPQEVRFASDSYQLPDQFATASALMTETSGCGLLDFKPTFTALPTSRRAAAPTGLHVDLTVPQNEAPDGLAASQLRDARVFLPEGMTIAPGAANGLEACSADQVGYRHSPPEAAHCPQASKIGTAEFDVPALSRTIDGAVYQRTPESGHLFRIWLVTDELGVHAKIPGEVEADPVTGRVTSVFLDNPQVPLRELKLHFKGGPRGVLATPSGCGAYRTEFEFGPWSGAPPVIGSTPMTIDEGCDTGGFAPRLSAGTANPAAGAFSSFLLNLTAESGEQNLAGLEVTMPPGLLAKLAGVPLCPDAQAATGDCPAVSQIGTTAVATGPGSSPLWIPQPGKAPTAVYLAGPYKGGPYSLVVNTPAQAGPFDLGDVVVRAAIHVDSETTQVSVKSDPLPQILEGVPISYRTVHVEANRPTFTLNPTSCRQMAVDARTTSNLGAVRALADRFQVGGCASLGFEPKLQMRLFGKTNRGAHPRLRAVLTTRSGNANIARAAVTLPRSEFLDQGHIRTVCTRVQFAADECPAGSIYGQARAISPLLDQPLKGPVYLRSSSNTLPDLVVALHGQVDVDLAGRIDSVKGGLRSTFAFVPDAPVSKFILTMQGGRKGLIVNSTNLCDSANRATVKFTGQNAKRHDSQPALRVGGCAGKPEARRNKHP